MPRLIAFIDRIAREKNHGVLMIRFKLPSVHIIDSPLYEYEQFQPRKEVIAWLDANSIKWLPCARQKEIGYSGMIYVDVPFDLAVPEYRKLAEYLENPDGSMRIEGVIFEYFPLELAMKYADQDEPGYWEKYWGWGDEPTKE